MPRTVSRHRPRFFVPPVEDRATGWRLPVESELYSKESMPRPRAQLDTVALARAFAAAGLHGTSIDAVAAGSGLAKPTLYARGGSKEELFALAVDAEAERLLERLDGAARPSDVARALDEHPREGLRLLLSAGDALGRILRGIALPEPH